MSLYDKFQIVFQLMLKNVQKKSKLTAIAYILQQYYVCIRNSIYSRTNCREQLWSLVRDWCQIYHKVSCFSYMISGLKQFGKLITIPYGFKNTVARQFCLKVQSLHHKSYGSNFFEMGKDIKIKHGVSSQVTLGSNKYQTQ